VVEEQELVKEVIAVVVAWVVQAEMNFGNFLSSSGLTDMVGIEDIEHEEMETIGSRVKGTVLKEG